MLKARIERGVWLAIVCIEEVGQEGASRLNTRIALNKQRETSF